MERRWLVPAQVGVAVATFLLVGVVARADLGALAFAAVVGVGAAGFIALRVSRPAPQLAGWSALAGVVGIVVGLVFGVLDAMGPTSHALHQVLGGIGAPRGFTEDRVARYQCNVGPFCPETEASRYYAGPGTVAAVAEELAARMRRACVPDATVSVDPATGTASVGGACPSREARVGASVSRSETGGVRISMSAYGL